MLRVIALALLVAPLAALHPVRAPLPDWPPDNGGDDHLDQCDTLGQEEWGQSLCEMWDDAMSLVSQADPSLAAEIAAQTGDGSVNVVWIQNPGTEGPNPAEETPELGGRSDSNTLGVEMVGRSPAEVAGSIIHEWQHVKGKAEDDEYDENELACNEASAYAAQLSALCTMSCEAGEEDVPACDEMNRVVDQYEANAAKCEAAEGTSSSPSNTNACTCS